MFFNLYTTRIVAIGWQSSWRFSSRQVCNHAHTNVQFNIVPIVYLYPYYDETRTPHHSPRPNRYIDPQAYINTIYTCYINVVLQDKLDVNGNILSGPYLHNGNLTTLAELSKCPLSRNSSKTHILSSLRYNCAALPFPWLLLSLFNRSVSALKWFHNSYIST